MGSSRYTPIPTSGAALPWNADLCACGKAKDVRALKCRACWRLRPVEKPCTGCSQSLPLDRFYQRRNGGIVSRCKECVCAAGLARPAEQKRRYDAAARRRPGHYKVVAARITRRRQEDLAFRLAERLRSSIRQAMKRNGARKDIPTADLIGCTVEEFRAHIEAQWGPGMAWSNYGPRRDCWQLDHIRPVASFDLTDPDQVTACFHFSNYQPLWTPENAAKGARWQGVAT